MFAIELAQYLDVANVLTYSESDGGDCFISSVPSTPDECIVITPSPAPEGSAKLGYDHPAFQVRARGTDPQTPYDRLRAIYDELAGLSYVTLSDGTYVVSVEAMQSDPGYIGQDANGRHEYTQNYVAEVRSATTHRE